MPAPIRPIHKEPPRSSSAALVMALRKPRRRSTTVHPAALRIAKPLVGGNHHRSILGDGDGAPEHAGSNVQFFLDHVIFARRLAIKPAGAASPQRPVRGKWQSRPRSPRAIRSPARKWKSGRRLRRTDGGRSRTRVASRAAEFRASACLPERRASDAGARRRNRPPVGSALRQASQGRNYHMTMDVFGNALCTGEGAVEAEYGVEDLAIEAEDLVAGLGPEGAIGRHVERVNLRTAGQPFGRPHQAKAGSIIAVQAAFGPGPDIAVTVLGERQDRQVLEPFGRPIMAETVLLSLHRRGEGEAGQDSRQHRSRLGNAL